MFKNGVRDKGWQSFIKNNEALLDIIYETVNIQQEGRLPPYFPLKENVLRFTAIPPDKIKGVIMGMDPYPSWTEIDGKIIPEATGRSFEVASVSSWQQRFKQASLRNILKAIYSEMEWDSNAPLDLIRNDIAAGYVKIPEPHELFDRLESRGILFLNAALTVEPGNPGAHMDIWKPFMDRLILYIIKASPDACWMLFGNTAQDRFLPILESNNAYIVKARHPRLTEFVLDRPFREISKILQECCQ